MKRWRQKADHEEECTSVVREVEVLKGPYSQGKGD
jgi:hypothetical protein